MEGLKIKSREYKVMLQAGKFQGGEAVLLEQAQAFWEVFDESIRNLAASTQGSLAEIDKRRLVRFLDTPDRGLRAHNYVVRERSKRDSSKAKVTLKFRHPDRYVSQDRNMLPPPATEPDHKFEQDIKSPFQSLFSYSSKQKVDESLEGASLGTVGQLFPGLVTALKSYDPNQPLQLVGRFTAEELVIEGGTFQITDSEEGRVECALIVWLQNSGDPEMPVAVEFSFRYGDNDERYSGGVARIAFGIFERLNGLTEWVNSKGLTKTAVAYSFDN